MTKPTKEQIDYMVDFCRTSDDERVTTMSWAKCITALADQRAELVALLTDASGEDCSTWSFACKDDKRGGPCWSCKRDALLARIGVTP